MPVPFGFSIGDFTTTVGAFRTVCVALRSHGGATSQYQETLNLLEGIKVIIQRVKDISLTVSTDNDKITKLVQDLAEQAGVCDVVVSKITNEVSQYDPALGSQAPQGYNRGAWSKAKWALYFSQELDRTRQVIGTHASSMTLSFLYLLYLYSLTFVESFKQQEQLQRDIERNVTAISSKLDSNRVLPQDQNLNVLAGLNDLVSKVTGLGDTELDQHEVLMRTLASMPSEIAENLSELNTKLDQLLKQRETSYARSSSIQIGSARKAEVPQEQQSLLPVTNGQKSVGLTPAELDSRLLMRAHTGSQKLHWQSSIVDLLKLLNLNSGLPGRKLLAGELSVHAGLHGSSEQNTALHVALMKELAEHGGMVPGNIHDLLQT